VTSHRRRARLSAVFLAALAGAGAPTRAHAQTAEEARPAIPVPTTELRLVAGGAGAGPELATSLFDHRLRIDAGIHAGKGVFGEAAALVRVLGSAANGLWVRGGFMYHRIPLDCLTDQATAWDAGLAYRVRFAEGSLIAAETGVEHVSRPTGISCNDSVLDAQSNGVRVNVAGQYALTRRLGLLARIGVRTGQHVMEIGVLPEFWIGLAYEI
jgi:hypothetical protein